MGVKPRVKKNANKIIKTKTEIREADDGFDSLEQEQVEHTRSVEHGGQNEGGFDAVAAQAFHDARWRLLMEEGCGIMVHS